ncbi:hypothetical protein NDN08_003586 [Rhodosorus marinus]|uniref:Nucleoporin Nup54 alpha-helical domain-containing protein n=1 Tax=Rhodosorus marinus TaxID=101924 RepID=A0AAV8UYI2_9RHOD|nr:hypothetical protein NDN08_003586 [Rhodosorus marinus]
MVVGYGRGISSSGNESGAREPIPSTGINTKKSAQDVPRHGIQRGNGVGQLGTQKKEFRAARTKPSVSRPTINTHISGTKRQTLAPRSIASGDFSDGSREIMYLGTRLLQWYAINARYNKKVQADEQRDCKKLHALSSELCTAREEAARRKVDQREDSILRKLQCVNDNVFHKLESFISTLDEAEKVNAHLAQVLELSDGQYRVQSAVKGSGIDDVMANLAVAESDIYGKVHDYGPSMQSTEQNSKALLAVVAEEDKLLAEIVSELSTVTRKEVQLRSAKLDELVRNESPHASQLSQFSMEIVDARE